MWWVAEGFGGQTVAIDAPFDELGVTASVTGGDGGGNMPIDRSEDFVGEFRMQSEASLGHGGGGVESS